MTEQFSLPNCHYMISTMAEMGFYSKPLLDICSKQITGKNYSNKVKIQQINSKGCPTKTSVYVSPRLVLPVRERPWNPFHQDVCCAASLQGAAP